MKLLKTSFDTKDKISETICLIFLIANIIIVSSLIPNLPDTIPTHYNSTGVADRYESKHILWLILAFSIVIYISLTILSVFPGLYGKIPANDTIAEQYRLTAKNTRMMKAVLILSLLIIPYFMANQKLQSEGYFFLSLFVITMIFIVRLGKT